MSIRDQIVRGRGFLFAGKLAWVAALSAVIATQGTAQTTIHVPADQPTIQAGIDAAVNGDTVLVAPGTYAENIDFKGKAITVTSGATAYAGATATIIQPSQPGPGVNLSTNEPSTAVLNGFTIQGVYGLQTSTANIAGVLISGSAPTITNNVIQQNRSCGILIVNGGSPTVTGNHIWYNRYPATTDPPSQSMCGLNSNALAGTGIGIFNGGSITLQSNLIEHNTNVNPHGPEQFYSAGVSLLNAQSIVLKNNVIQNNTPAIGEDVILGYQLHWPATTAMLVQNIIGSFYEGGDSEFGLNESQITLIATNNTFGGAAMYVPLGVNSVLENNLFYTNSPGNFTVDCIGLSYSTPISYSDVFATSGMPTTCQLANADVETDPLFLNAGADDFHTQRNSPVLAAGTVTAPYIPSEDMDHKNRTVCGTIDMGVYEVHPQPATVITSSNNPAPGGSNVTLTATVPGNCNTPTGTVTFLDGTTALGTMTLDASAKASVSTSSLTVGSHSITVTYPGDFNFDASTSAVFTQVITGYPTATTLVQVSPNPAQALQNVTFSASVTSQFGNPSGTISFYAGSTLLGSAATNAGGTASMTAGSLTPGSYNITAVYSPTTEFASSTSAMVPLVVNGAQTTTKLSSTPNPSAFGQPISLTVSVTSPQSTAAPTGTITIMDGSTVLGSGTLTPTGTYAFTTSALTVGSHSLTAIYSGSSNDNASTSNIDVQIVGAGATVTALTATPNPANQGQAVVLTATVIPQVSGVPPPGGTVVFADQFGTLGSMPLAGGTANLSLSSLALGTHNIVASYGGASGYAASNSNTVAEVIQPYDFAVAVSSTSVSIPSGDYHPLTVTLTPLGGFRDTVALNCTLFPINAECYFQPTSKSLANGPQTVTLILNTNQVYEFGRQAKLERRLDDKRPLNLRGTPDRPVIPGLLLFPLLPLRRAARRRMGTAVLSLGLLIAIIGVAPMVFLQGCGNGKIPGSTPPGTYTVTVLATDTTSSLAHSVNIQLVVR
ncbi:parallel beta-helix repeat (two copies) [Bryocella elongata]|uniref:Parallel beta-helix repeat (Two copies) n=1 Tax=Bryocella elongata TaxID=863522 RepID=A0A1H5TPX1_9BACT|nr:Ig-like domain repeat protein [Bryocella elongata]SEF64823.1 parallel beta-helix repeat (two copies) [Bryocella elongata]